MKNLIPTLLCDFYKISHREQYPKGTEIVYSTWIPRSNKYLPQADSAIAFGFQAFIKEWFIDFFDHNFFHRPLTLILQEYVRYIKYTLGVDSPYTQHIKDLHELGYLPLEVRALPEGTRTPFRVPMLTVHNTHPKFFWLTNYFETLMSCELWKVSTVATIADLYRQILDKYAIETTGSTDGVEYQGHDFAMRGSCGINDSAVSSMGHLLSFVGTDTISAIMGLEQYYNADIEKEIVGKSVPATEHSVMCAGGIADEFETYKRLITEIYPKGILSIVSDTWDLWYVLIDTIPKLKNEILARDGKIVIRPDSGDPADIICGSPLTIKRVFERKGVIELLWDIFGGTINKQGYKVLDSHIGAIYGDAITLETCENICERLADKGFASTNVIFGIGSFAYQYRTRDTLGFAMKSTLTVCNGKEVHIFKDPITDDGTKKSLKGGVAVQKDSNGTIYCVDEIGLYNFYDDDLLEVVFKDGKLLRDESLSEIRARLREVE